MCEEGIVCREGNEFISEQKGVKVLKFYLEDAMQLLNEMDHTAKVKNRDKNLEFKIQYGLSDSDICSFVKSLQRSNFVRRIVNKDKKIDADYLYEFETILQFNDEYGLSCMKDIYIKICKLKKLNIILIVSFHPKEY